MYPEIACSASSMQGLKYQLSPQCLQASAPLLTTHAPAGSLPAALPLVGMSVHLPTCRQ